LVPTRWWSGLTQPRSRRAGTIKNKVDVQHGPENAPATPWRLFESRNEGRQLLRGGCASTAS
jgi:NADPH-dependent curcumin reductase CurA